MSANFNGDFRGFGSWSLQRLVPCDDSADYYHLGTRISSPRLPLLLFSSVSDRHWKEPAGRPAKGRCRAAGRAGNSCACGGHSAGQARAVTVGRGRSNDASAQSLLAAQGARWCKQQAGCVNAPGRSPVENVRWIRVEPIQVASVPGQLRLDSEKIGVRADHTITKCNAKGEGLVNQMARNDTSRQNTIVQKL